MMMTTMGFRGANGCHLVRLANMIKTTTKQVIDLGDWDNLVIETYGKPYSFQQQYGCQERGSYTITIPEETIDRGHESIPEKINGDLMGVKFDVWLARDPKEWNGHPSDRVFDLFWLRNFYPDIQMVANDLHSKGLIPAGTYDIEIDW